MEKIIIIFDIVIALLSIWTLVQITGYGGQIGRSLSMVGYGIIIVGFSQIIETVGINVLIINIPTIEIIHRLILIIGITIIAFGFKNLMLKK